MIIFPSVALSLLIILSDIEARFSMVHPPGYANNVETAMDADDADNTKNITECGPPCDLITRFYIQCWQGRSAA